MSTKDFDKTLARFAEEVNLAAKRTLGSRKIGKNRSYGVASRSLQKSLTYSIQDGQVSFGSPLPYAAFIHWGVNGTRKSRQAPFSFRNEDKLPVPAIIKWMKAKGIRPRDKDGKFVKNIGPRGGDRRASTAYLIARAIKRKGIPGLRYYSVALETMVPKFRDELGEALANDLLASIKFTSGPLTVKPK